MPERRCEGCKRQVEWGCTARRWRRPGVGEQDVPDNWIAPATTPVTVDDEYLFACPRQSIREQPVVWSRMLQLWGMYRRGFLPESGGALDQSNVLMSLFAVIDAANSACDKIELERSSKKGDPRRH